MVKHNTLANFCGGMNVDTEYHGNTVLQYQSQRAALVVPQPVGDAIGGESVKTLVIQKGSGKVMAGGIAFVNSNNIAAGFVDNCRVTAKGIVKDFPYQ